MADATRNCCGTSTLDECRCPPADGHTIGPWEVMPATVHHGYYVGQWGGTICDLYTMSNPSVPSTRNGGDSFPVPFQEGSDAANARLIAAAPDLLEAVYQYRDDLRFPPEADSVERRLAMIDGLISKIQCGAI